MKRILLLLAVICFFIILYVTWQPSKPIESKPDEAPVIWRVTAQPRLLSASNENFILAINSFGEIWGWGNNRDLQLGAPHLSESPIPLIVASGSPWHFVYVHAGTNASYAIDQSGILWRRPYAEGEQISYYGKEAQFNHQLRYDPFMAEIKWNKAAESWGAGVGLDVDGQLWIWREKRIFRKVFIEGKEWDIPQPVAHQIQPMHKWVDFCTGQGRLLAVAQDGTFWKYEGELPKDLYKAERHYAETGREFPFQMVHVPAKAHFNRVRCWMYADHVFLLTAAGEMWGYGANHNGELGNGDDDRFTENIKVKETEIAKLSTAHWADIVAAPGFSLGIQADGSLWAWGLNGVGQLGLGDNNSHDVPKLVDRAHTWVAVAATHDSAAALNTEGEIYTWGNGSGGRLADGGAAANLLRPTKIFDSQRWGVGLEEIK